MDSRVRFAVDWTAGVPENAGPLPRARRSGVQRAAEHPSGERCAGDRPTGRKRRTGVRYSTNAVRACRTHVAADRTPYCRSAKGAYAATQKAVLLSSRAALRACRTDVGRRPQKCLGICVLENADTYGE